MAESRIDWWEGTRAGFTTLSSNFIVKLENMDTRQYSIVINATQVGCEISGRIRMT